MSGSEDPNLKIWQRSKSLSTPFWALYERLIVSKRPEPTSNETNGTNEQPEIDFEVDADLDSNNSDELANEDGDWDIGDSEPDYEEEDEDEYFQYDDEEDNDDEKYNDCDDSEYMEFIEVTRKHQAERERLKKLEQNKSDPEEYYVDVSQVNTLVESNLVNAPSIDDESSGGQKERDEELIKLYGSQEAFERIRSMEMNIDEQFNKKYSELKPKYWPSMPLNPKPYLNPIIRD